MPRQPKKTSAQSKPLLFQDEGRERQSRLDQTADKLKERFGVDALRRGSGLLHGAKHRPMPRPGQSDG